MSAYLPDGCHITDIPGFRPCDELPVCSECDGACEVGVGRDWQTMTCPHCEGTGIEPEREVEYGEDL